MSIDDGDLDRLVAGEPFADDAAWSGVAAFLDDLRSVYPPGSIAGFETEHLAAVARESRIIAANSVMTGTNVLSMRRTRFRRVLVSSVAGATVLLTAGVGAAAAMGINPIAQLVAPRMDQQVRITPTPAPPSDGTPPAPDGGRPGGRPTSVPPVSVPSPTPTEGTTVDPTASSKPTKPEKTKKPKKDKKDKSNNGKSDQTKDKSDKTNNGKSKTSP